MRMGDLFATIFLLVTTSVAGQIATGIYLVEVRFSGHTQLEAVDLKKCAADLRSRTYEGPEWLDTVSERVRRQCLQDKGYFKAAVNPLSRQLPDKRGTHQFVVTFNIDAGPQYRMGQIAFRNNRVYSVEELRSMVKLPSGEIFSPTNVRRGLDQMRRAYVERGYLNFTLIPDPNIDDKRHVINLVIDCNEGQQVRSVNPS